MPPFLLVIENEPQSPLTERSPSVSFLPLVRANIPIDSSANVPLRTTPPSFILCRLSAPIFFTLDFLITNSPGVNMAGTVSLLPLPGTTPPVANFCGVAAPLPIIPPAKLFSPLNIFMPAMSVSIGSRGLSASAILIRADARDRAVLAMSWKVALSLTALTNAKNSSLTLVILTANACWALMAS